MKDSFISDNEIENKINDLEKNKEKSLLYPEDNSGLKNNLVETNNDKKSFASTMIIGEVNYRFIIVVCFFLLSFSNGLQWLTISPISENFAIVYDRSITELNLFSLSYMVVFPFIFPVAAYIIEEKSVRGGMVFAATLNIIGACFKISINSNFGLAMAGQWIAAIAQPFILSASGKISSIWFRPDMVKF